MSKSSPTDNIKTIGLIFLCWVFARFSAGIIHNLTLNTHSKILAVISIFLFTCANALLIISILYFLVYLIKKVSNLIFKR